MCIRDRLGTAALNLAAGRDIDDVAKATLASFVAGEVGKTVSGAPSVVDTLGKTGANIAGRVAGSVATGGGEEGALNALLTGGVSLAMPEIQGMIPGYENLSPAQKTFVNSAIASTLKDGNLSPQELIQAAVRVGTTASKSSSSGKVDKTPLSPEELRQLVDNRLDKMFFANNDLDAQEEEISARTQEILDELANTNTPTEYEEFLRSIGITNQSKDGPSPSNQEILDAIFYESELDGRPSAKDLGTIEVVGERPPADDLGTVEVVGERPNTTDLGEIEIVGERPLADAPPPADDLGEIEIVGERPVTPVELPAVLPVTPITPTTPTTPTKPPTKVTPKQVAQVLGVPVSSPMVQEVIEALYGTMEYLDIGEEFDPSKRKVKPAATQKQLQQTKMAQGGYLDTMLAEEMSADDLLKLLR